MTAEFQATGQVSPELCSAISALEPNNPFCTFAYAQAMEAIGTQPWLLYLKDNERFTGGCLGFLRAGRLSRSLEVPSVPTLPTPDVFFWTELVNLCARMRVSNLSLQSFGSACPTMPCLPGETDRRSRVEHILILQGRNIGSAISSNHRRNIQKAEKAGVRVERSSTRESCREHVLLQDASMERRLNRGEQVEADAQMHTPLALVQYGAGEFFRAVRAGQALSSILVLRAPSGAYYHSAGTSREGMAIGASHLLIREVAEILRVEGMQQFNLGGADPSSSGLARFKMGFGTQAISLEAAQFCFSGRLQRSVTALVNLTRRFVHIAASHGKDPAGTAKQRATDS